MSNLLQAALDYADKGWYVFPCREKLGTPYEKDGEIITPTEKSPYIAGGLHSASRDAEQIKEWWTVYPNALIGVNTGKSGLFVVDIDRKNVNGFETFSTWEVNDSKGFHSRTPSGGMHIIFTGVGKSSTNVKTGIDTRGDGGYIIVPPSKILEGKVTGDYVKFDDWSGTPGVIPDGLMSKLFPQDTTEYVRGTSSLSFDGKRQLSRASLNFLIEGAPEGERNSTLFKVMADFAGCGYTKEETKEAILPVCERIGLGRSECIEVLNHAYSKPRTASIPDSIQEKILLHGKKVVKSITYAEQAIIEDALIGCMLNDNSNIGVINDILDFDDFQVLKNRWIYKTINYLSATSSGRLDYIIVYDAVSRETDKVSFEDLATIVEKYKNIDTELAISYAEIIKEKSALRKVEALMDNKEQYFESGNLLEVVTAIERDLTNIAIAGGAKSTAVLDSEQAVEMVKVQTELRRKGESGQLEIGFPMFDRYLGGLYPNELVILAARAGQGKCLAKGTRVIMFDGTMKKVEDIKVGDLVMGVDSKPRTVLSLSHGFDNMYKVSQNRGIDYIVNSNHILSLKKSYNDYAGMHGEVTNISIKEYTSLGKRRKRDLKGYKVAVEFPKKELPLEPYMLGVWLGDGSSAKASITSADKEISQYIYKFAKQNNYKVGEYYRKDDTKTCTYSISGGFKVLLRDTVGVLNNKHIPHIYLTSSREDRLELLAGLLDTDGYSSYNGFEITQKNKELAYQIKWLADSLGFRTSIREVKKGIKATGFVGTYYRVVINGKLWEIPTKIKRKQIKESVKRIDQTVTGITVTECGIGEYYGFTIDGDNLFLLEDFTVTHNSALALSIANYVAIRKRKTVAFFSLEMSTHETICRLICQLSGLAYRDVFQGRLTEEEWVKYGEATEQIKNSPLYFDDSFGLTVPEMRSKIRRLMDEGLALVVIDQLEQVRGYDSLAPHLRMDRLAYEIKSLTQEFNVPIILNHQLNRNITDRRFKDAEPQLSDLNQAGEKPANQVWSIVCKTDEEGINYDYAIKMLKNRNGTKLRIPMTFMGERMLFAPVYDGEDMSANNSYTSELPDESYMQEEMSTIDWIPS